MDKEQTSAVPAMKKTLKRLPWWLWTAIIVAAAAIITIVIVSLTTKPSDTNNATNKPDTTEEITIKQYLSSLRGDIVRYREEKQTYSGWTPNATAIDQVKKMGSEIKTQALSQDNYIIYAKMPSSKTVFCMDKDYTGEVSSLMPWAKSCK